MTINNETLKKVYPASIEKNRKLYLEHINNAMAHFGITERLAVCAFLAQIGVESGQLHYSVENLNYSASALRTVFGKYFTTEAMAKEYARKPEKIANRVYANRMGNGSEESGDGWRYRGRGLIQVTGKDNYRLVSESLDIDFILQPDLLAMPKFAALSAAEYWHRNGLNELAKHLGGNADADTFKAITKRINGGYNGLKERMEIYNLCKRYIP